jgi:SAM-dependent methyltransferase
MAGAGLGGLFDAGAAEFAVLGPVLWEPIAAATVVVAGPRPGERVLDVCCGAGSSAIPAARAVGPEGHVDAIDLAERLLAQGRDKAADLPQLRFVRADADSWPHGGYDVVQCVHGIYFLTDLDSGADRLVTLLRPGGRFVVTTWSADAIWVVRGILADAIEAEGERAAPVVGCGPSGRVDTADKLAAWLTARGLRAVEVVTKEHRMPLDGTTAWAVVTGTAMRTRLDGLADSVLPAVRSRFIDLLAARGVDNMNAVSLIGIGRTG